MRQLPLVVVSRDCSSLRRLGFSLQWLLLLQSMDSGCRLQELWCVGSVVVVRGFGCPEACGILAPRPGIEPVSSALAGGFSSGPPAKFVTFLLSKFPVCDALLLCPGTLILLLTRLTHRPSWRVLVSSSQGPLSGGMSLDLPCPPSHLGAGAGARGGGRPHCLL